MLYGEEGLRIEVAESHAAYPELAELIVRLNTRAKQEPGVKTVEEKVVALRDRHAECAAWVRKLWPQCRRGQRGVLKTLAERGEMSQLELEAALGLSRKTELRGRNAGLGKICHRIKVANPIVKVGGSRDVRSFSLAPGFGPALLVYLKEGRA